MKILVTGCAGFIGAAFCRHILRTTDHTIIGLSRNSTQLHNLRLSSDADCLKEERKGFGIYTKANSRLSTYWDRLTQVYGDLTSVSGLCSGIDVVVNFAAKTFVDHSIRDPWPFIKSNVLGTYAILEDARKNGVKKFIQVSTDEVYGSIAQGAYAETARLNPTNPYSATKAGADALAISYAHTFGLHTVVTRTENNYGPLQGPEKVFPVFTKKLLNGEPLPVYGDGGHVRQWLWVDDHVKAIYYLINYDTVPGEVYHVAGNQELTNLRLAEKIIKAFSPEVNLWQDKISFIDDHNIRPGHDRRYALNCDKLRMTGWKPEMGLDEGIQRAVDWYKENPQWLR